MPYRLHNDSYEKCLSALTKELWIAISSLEAKSP